MRSQWPDGLGLDVGRLESIRDAEMSDLNDQANFKLARPLNPSPDSAKNETEYVDCAPGGRIIWKPTNPDAVGRWSIKLTRVVNSGGHHHSHEPMPVGKIEPASGNGKVPAQWVYTAPQFSGLIRQDYYWNGQQSSWPDFNRVIVKGLVALKASRSIRLIGWTKDHPDHHYGHPALLAKLKVVCEAFYQKYKKPVDVNDLSLVWGGQFDCRSTPTDGGTPKPWQYPHEKHRVGRNADIRIIAWSKAERDFFKETAKREGFYVKTETDPPHDHLYLDAGDEMITAWEEWQRSQ